VPPNYANLTTNPSSFNVTLNQGDQTTRNLVIGNSGTVDPLSYTLVEPVDVPWLTAEPTSGTILAGQNETSVLTFNAAGMPVGINALRSDGEAAVAIAAASGAQYVRVNVHMSVVVSEQGIIEGMSQLSVRLRSALKSNALIFADVGVKHAAALADRGLTSETRDLAERGLADAIIVSGDRTGAETSLDDVDVVRAATTLPLLIGSGATPDNVARALPKVDGLIVGSYFKRDGVGNNFVDEARVQTFVRKVVHVRMSL